MVHLAKRTMIAPLAFACAASTAAADNLPSGPLPPPGEVEVLQAVAARNGAACGSSNFYPWFAGMLAVPAFQTRSPTQRLETFAGLFGTERARKAFRSAVKDIASLASKETHVVPFPNGAPKRPICNRERLKHDETLIDYSRPYRMGDLVFIEQTIGSHNRTGVGILALEKASDGEWKIADLAVGPISD